MCACSCVWSANVHVNVNADLPTDPTLLSSNAFHTHTIFLHERVISRIHIHIHTSPHFNTIGTIKQKQTLEESSHENQNETENWSCARCGRFSSLPAGYAITPHSKPLQHATHNLIVNSIA
jgi:hypothetical protein